MVQLLRKYSSAFNLEIDIIAALSAASFVEFLSTLDTCSVSELW